MPTWHVGLGATLMPIFNYNIFNAYKSCGAKMILFNKYRYHFYTTPLHPNAPRIETGEIVRISTRESI